MAKAKMPKANKSNKKPTNKEIVQVCNSLIQNVEYMNHQIMTLTSVLDIYVEFKEGDPEIFKAFATKELKRRMDEHTAKVKKETEEAKANDTQTDVPIDAESA
jgi:hypothetical protein